jgi:1-phosphatidylinositol-4-phosphate 5-kinase
VPKGNGNFKWPDESLYVGNWSKDPSEQNGTYYPSQSSSDANLEWNPQNVYNVDLKDCKICPGEKVSILPSQKKLAVWRSSKSDGVKPRRMSVDGRVSIGLERPLDRMQMWNGSTGDDSPACNAGERASTVGRYQLDDHDLMGLNLEERGQMKEPKTARRQGETISRGHKNYELMLNLQLGIR